MSQILTILTTCFLALSSHALNIEYRGTETWVQLKFSPVTSTSADILFVIDNSGSMDVHQKNLTKNLTTFLNTIPQTFLQAGVLTTTAKDQTWGAAPFKKAGHLIDGIHQSTSPQFVSNLSKSLLAGTDGDALEKHFDSIALALSEPLLSTVNSGFLRADADLYIVILTDTQDQSQIDEKALYAQIKALKPNNTITTLAGMALSAPSCSGETSEMQKNPPKIQNFVGLTGGSVFSLCGDFAQNIQDAMKYSTSTENSLTLVGTESLKTPIFNTIQVKVGNESFSPGDINTGWVYNSKTKVITFSEAILAKSIAYGPIEVTYQVQ